MWNFSNYITLRSLMIFLAFVGAAITGMATIIGGTPIVPLIIGGFVIVTAISIAFLKKPLLALYATVFLGFMPQGLISENIHSIIFDGSLAFAIISWILSLLYYRKAPVWSTTSFWITALLLWSICTITWASDPIVARRAIVAAIIGFSVFVLIDNQIKDIAGIDGLMSVLEISGWMLIILGVGTALFSGYTVGTRLKVFEQNENLYGILIITTLPGLIWRTMRSSGRWRSTRMVLGAVFIGLSLLIITLTGSRGSVISLLVILLAFWFCKPTRPWAILGLGIGIIGLAMAPFAIASITNRFENPEEEAFGGRLELWQASLALVSDHPWGVGVGNAPLLLPTYVNQITDTYSKRRSIPGHNPILEVASDTGLIGMILYIGALSSAIISFARSYSLHRKRGDPAFKPYFGLIFCVFLGYMLSWVKGGGLSYHITYMLMLALLTIPSQLVAERARANTALDEER
jgi:O-antigen ligase